jgi:hypothetical protein
MLRIARRLHQAITRLILASRQPLPLLLPQSTHLPPIPPIQQTIQRINLLELPRLVDRGRIDLLARLGAEAGCGQERLVDAAQEDVLELAVGTETVFGPEGEGALVVAVDDLGVLGG